MLQTLVLLLLLAAAPLAHAASATLGWDAPVPQAGFLTPEGYALFRHDATSSTFVEVCRTPAATLRCTDTLPTAQVYTYHVKSYAGSQLSGPSNEVSVPIPGLPGTPRNLSVTVTVTVDVP